MNSECMGHCPIGLQRVGERMIQSVWESEGMLV